MINIDKKLKYIIGISGGPDSIYLLLKILECKPKDLIVAHVNYRFRKTSDKDQQLVEEFCRKYELKFRVKIINPSIYNYMKINFEA